MTNHLKHNSCAHDFPDYKEAEHSIIQTIDHVYLTHATQNRVNLLDTRGELIQHSGWSRILKYLLTPYPNTRGDTRLPTQNRQNEATSFHFNLHFFVLTRQTFTPGGSTCATPLKLWINNIFRWKKRSVKAESHNLFRNPYNIALMIQLLITDEWTNIKTALIRHLFMLTRYVRGPGVGWCIALAATSITKAFLFLS